MDCQDNSDEMLVRLVGRVVRRYEQRQYDYNKVLKLSRVRQFSHLCA